MLPFRLPLWHFIQQGLIKAGREGAEAGFSMLIKPPGSSQRRGDRSGMAGWAEHTPLSPLVWWLEKGQSAGMEVTGQNWNVKRLCWDTPKLAQRSQTGESGTEKPGVSEFLF